MIQMAIQIELDLPEKHESPLNQFGFLKEFSSEKKKQTKGGLLEADVR